MSCDRRKFLLGSAAASAVAMVPLRSASSQMEPTLSNQSPNRDIMMKFSANGKVLPFAGNTVICHMPVQCAMRGAMAAFHGALEQSMYLEKLGLTTVDSYHMTIFPGANDQGRKASGWPSYVAADATMQQCDEAVEQRMRAARLHCGLPFRVEVDVPATLNYPRACTLRMRAVDAEEEAKLRSVRDQLAQIYGFRLPDHATYAFHITMSYQTAPFTQQEAEAFTTLRAEAVRRIVAAQPVLELGNPEYCTFNDMFRFEPKVLLRCTAGRPEGIDGVPSSRSRPGVSIGDFNCRK